MNIGPLEQETQPDPFVLADDGELTVDDLRYATQIVDIAIKRKRSASLSKRQVDALGAIVVNTVILIVGIGFVWGVSSVIVFLLLMLVNVATTGVGASDERIRQLTMISGVIVPVLFVVWFLYVSWYESLPSGEEE